LYFSLIAAISMQAITTLSFDVRLNTKPTYWHCEPGWEWRSPPLADHLLWCVLDGVGTMRLDDEAWTLTTGSCFIFPLGARPHGMQDPERRLVVYGMHFDVVPTDGGDTPGAAQIHPPHGHILRDLGFFAALGHHCDASYRRGDELGAQQSRLYLRAMILHLWEEILHPAPSTVDIALDEIVRELQREPGKRQTVAELARRAHLSRAQFARRFRALTGLSPARFMIQTRLERARQLIQETNMPLGQIAAALGYDDVYFFSRQYKHYAGRAPSTLRRQASGEAGR
jgi:AraC family transcriptional regulator, arabinose operon regulatory protein